MLSTPISKFCLNVSSLFIVPLGNIISVQTPSAAAGFELQYRWNDVQIKKHFTSPMMASLSLSGPPGDQEGWDSACLSQGVWLHRNRALPLDRIVSFPTAGSRRQPDHGQCGPQCGQKLRLCLPRCHFRGPTRGCLASRHMARVSFEGDFWKPQRTESQEHTS